MVSPTLAIALSGVKAATKTVSAVAENVANAETVGAPGADGQGEAGAGAARGAGAQVYQPVDVVNVGLAGGGVAARAWGRTPASSPAYDPENPAAGADGMVARPNVDLAREMMALDQARHAYEAGLKVMKVEDEMLGEVVDLTS